MRLSPPVECKPPMTLTFDHAEPLRLAVTHTAPAAEGTRLFEFHDPGAADLPEFTAGSHVTVRVPTGELRKYSLCNDPAERDRYVIAVKREADGRGGSISMTDGVKVGDVLEVSHPKNDFILKPNRAGYLLVAGGIGITPLMSMMRYLKASGGPRFKLYYLSRSPATTAFREELNGAEFRGQVTIHYDEGDPTRSFDLWPILEQPKGVHLYCCGPIGLMQAVRDMTGHWSPSAIHFESFLEGSQTHRAEDRPFVVHLARSGDTVEIPADKTILEVLRARGHELASSCESGTCGTCKTRYLGGYPLHRDLVLSDSEKAEHVMICVSRAGPDGLELDL
jgi:phthalate 4,5-dioxygenase reductase component